MLCYAMILYAKAMRASLLCAIYYRSALCTPFERAQWNRKLRTYTNKINDSGKKTTERASRRNVTRCHSLPGYNMIIYVGMDFYESRMPMVLKKAPATFQIWYDRAALLPSLTIQL